ncbi:MAG: NRAMP family divalent metal transporter [Gemmatimonadales bacterium]
MKKWGEIALGVVTSIGGFLEAGSITTAAQGGAEFGLQLGWALLAGVLCLALLMEMTGRLAAVSRRSYVDLLREHLGARFFVAPLVAVVIPGLLVLAAEIGGIAVALQMATGIAMRWWALPIAVVGWALLWRGTFSVVEQGTAILGLVAIVFAFGAWKLHPQWSAVGAGLLPTAPTHDRVRYWYIAVSILGASISPYLYLFYSAGAIEDGWTNEYLAVNRVTAGVGNLFGGGLALTVLVCAAVVFGPHHVKVSSFQQMSLLLSTPLGKIGFALFLLTLCITCFGATMEITLAGAYLLAQGRGWPWSENVTPARDSRFATTCAVTIIVGAIPILFGADPIVLTSLSMVLSAASLPVTVIPLLILMNDRQVMRRHANGWLTNGALAAIAILSIVLFLASLPLQLGGGG